MEQNRSSPLNVNTEDTCGREINVLELGRLDGGLERLFFFFTGKHRTTCNLHLDGTERTLLSQPRVGERSSGII